MNGKIPKKIPAGVSILIIAAVLVGVQVFWWKGLVAKPKVSPPGGGGPRQGGGASNSILIGREEIKVITISGDLPPGIAEGTGYNARFDRPAGLALDLNGSLLVCDPGNNRIRRIANDGETSTLTGAEAGDKNGELSEARFNAPCGIAVARNGDIYVADTGGGRLRLIRKDHVSSIYPPETTASAGSSRDIQPLNIAVSDTMNPTVTLTDFAKNRILSFNSEGAFKIETKTPSSATSIALTPDLALTFPQTGDIRLGTKTLHTPDIDGKLVSGGGDPLPKMKNPLAICSFGKDYFVSDSAYGAIFLIRDGKAEVIAGFCSTGGAIRGYKDGNGASSLFSVICGLAYDGKKYLYASDTDNNCIRRLDVSSLIR